MKIAGLPSQRVEEAARAARRAGLEVVPQGTASVLRGPASAFAAFGREGGVGAAAAAALDRFRNGPRVLEAGGRALALERPLIVGILNATPDSFYDRGRYFSLPEALARADEMVAEGADLIEVGGETARPGPRLDADEECRRVVPLIEALAGRLSVPVSVDTYKPEVAVRAVGAGAVMINDISGLADVRLAEVAAQRGAALVVMHILGRPKVRQPSPKYEAVVDEVYAFLEAQTGTARAAGVPRARLVVDPGFSFGKAPRHDVEILRRLGEFRGLGYPLYLATSRKNYIRDLLSLPFEELLEGTAAAVAYGLAQGAHFVRTHDVRFMARLARMMHAVLHLGEWSGPPRRSAMEVTRRGEG
ncbi:MAG TPA: dihydropteroate synthase [bacterium]|nr:dihydropteroate synthase [bacterium]